MKLKQWTGPRIGLRAAMVLLFVATLARPASADWLLTPYIGGTFGGAPNTINVVTLRDAFETRTIYGGTIGFMGGGIFGLEADFSYTPDFFKLTDDVGNDAGNVDSSMTTLMGNLVLGIPIGGTRGVGFRPYVSGGIGLMRGNIEIEDLFTDLSANDFAVNVGGGLHLFFSDHFGLRGDLRYFRGLEDNNDNLFDDDDIIDNFNFGDFDFWRGTIGVTFRFGG